MRGILYYNTILSRNHRPLYIEIDILLILGYPIQGTVKALERNLKVHGPRLIDAYQESLIQKLINRNISPILDDVYTIIMGKRPRDSLQMY
jgi:hypothetical protein